TGSDRPSGSQIAIDDLAGNRLGLAAPTAGGIRAEAGDPRKIQLDRTVLVARPRHISGNTIDLIAESAAAKARDDSSILEIVVQHGHSLPLSNREQPGAKRVNLVILCGGNAAACPISSQASSIDTTYHNAPHKNGSSRSFSCTSAASPSTPLRISVTPQTIQIFVPAESPIIGAAPVRRALS